MVMNMNMQGGQPAGQGTNDSLQQLMKMLGIGTGLAGAAGGAYGLSKGSKPYNNPSTGAINTLSGIPGQVNPYYQPYADNGIKSMNTLNQQNEGLLNGTTQNDLGKNYKESPGYQYALQQALGAGNNASAAGGTLGTPMHQEQNMGIASGLASQDFQNYINNQMNLYNTGYHGTETMNAQGQDANKSMADWLGNTETGKAGLQYEGEKGKNEYGYNEEKNKNDLWKQILSGLGTAGGAFFGGPAGATAGGMAGGALGNFFGG